jgi:hypothetical protein
VDPDASRGAALINGAPAIHWFDNGKFNPHVYAITGARDPKTFKRVYKADPNKKNSVRFLGQALNI